MDRQERDKKLLSLYRQAEIFEQMIADQTRELYYAHKDLQSKNESLQKIMQAMTDMLLVVNPRGEILSTNHAVAQLLGYSEEELPGKPARILFADSEFFQKSVLEIVSQVDTLKNIDTTCRTKSGDKVSVALSASGIRGEKGGIQSIVCVARDMTERERAQSQQAFSQKMESIGRLAAGIAHEINTPMQFVGDNTRFLEESFRDLCCLMESYRKLLDPDALENRPQDLSERVRAKEKEFDIEYLNVEIPKAISQTLEGISRVNRIVLAMKDFSHADGETKSLCDINQGIVGTITISRSEWKYCAELEADLETQLPPVSCNRDQINQVILNMIINAADSIRDRIREGTLERGRIVIRTATVENGVQIVVEDNGKGIPAGIIGKIYDLFFTTKPEGKGTGQGLAIAHDIVVNKHKGTIDVASAPDQGTRFTIFLPLLGEAVDAIVTPSAP